MQFLTFWESWADTTIPLSGVPQGVTIVAVAFSTGTGGTMLLSPQNTNPIDAKTIHGQGGKIVISFGGATGTGAYSNLDANAFVTALSNFMSANPGVYDGIDFDDEADPRPPQPLIDVILATRAKFPLPFIITYDAFPSGADTGTDKTSDWQGSDLAVAPKVAGAINWVNVMDYNFGSWKPTDAKNCTVSQTASDDCRRDVLTDFAKIYPKNKILLGLEVPTADNGSEALTMADVTAYASYVKTNGYGGIMMWDLKRDTGFSYTKAIVSSLNTQGPPSQGPIVQPSPSTGGSAAASSAPGHHIGNIVITDIPKNYGATIQSAVDKYNKQYGTNLSAPFIEAIIFQESKGDPLAESQDGQDSKGLMQVSTASGFDIADLLSPGGNQYDPATSIDTGVHLLAIMDQCGSIKDPTVGNFYGTFPGACGNPLLLASKFQAGPQTTGVNTYGNQINGWMQSFQQGVQPTNGGQFPIGGKS